MFSKKEVKFDAKNCSLTIPAARSGVGKDAVVSAFDKVMVNILVVKDKKTKKDRVTMTFRRAMDSNAL